MALGRFVGFIRSSIKSFSSLVLTLLSVALYVVFVYNSCALLVHLALSVDVLWVVDSLITFAFQPTTFVIIIWFCGAQTGMTFCDRVWKFGVAGEIFVAAFATMTYVFALFCDFSLGDPEQFYAFAQEAKCSWDVAMIVIAAMIIAQRANRSDGWLFSTVLDWTVAYLFSIWIPKVHTEEERSVMKQICISMVVKNGYEVCMVLTKQKAYMHAKEDKRPYLSAALKNGGEMLVAYSTMTQGQFMPGERVQERFVMRTISLMIVIVKVYNAWEPLCKLCTSIRQTPGLMIFFKIIKTAIYLFFIRFAFSMAASKRSDQENLSALLFFLLICCLVAWIDVRAERIDTGAERNDNVYPRWNALHLAMRCFCLVDPEYNAFFRFRTRYDMAKMKMQNQEDLLVKKRRLERKRIKFTLMKRRLKIKKRYFTWALLELRAPNDFAKMLNKAYRFVRRLGPVIKHVQMRRVLHKMWSHATERGI